MFAIIIALWTGSAQWVGPGVCPYGVGACDHTVALSLISGSVRYTYPGLNGFVCSARLVAVGQGIYHEEDVSAGCVAGLVTIGPATSTGRSFRWERLDAPGTEITEGTVRLLLSTL